VFELWSWLLSGKGRLASVSNEATTRTLTYDLACPRRPIHELLALSATCLASECGSTKEIAFILGLPFSTAAERVNTGLDLLGLRSRVELVLVTEVVWIAHVRRDLACLLSQHTRIAVRPHGAAGLRVSIAEPTWPETCPVLTRAERAVVNRMLASESYNTIATAHGRAKRTIANQVRSTYTKLGVHDRAELARAYVRRCASSPSMRNGAQEGEAFAECVPRTTCVPVVHSSRSVEKCL
jgi:DNA-binding NarL/FixJ family response regulator